MIREIDITWQVIRHDPMLRRELASIEEDDNDERLAERLVEFFAKVESMIRLTAVIVEEDGGLRTEDRGRRTEDVRRASA